MTTRERDDDAAARQLRELEQVDLQLALIDAAELNERQLTDCDGRRAAMGWNR